ncbi:MAG: glycosyltransferase [Erysipelotrichaceae bacterium]|nr:glycosyltransferase [Erysipelotrichaceae bacterium]
MRKTVSVCIASYNGEKYITEQIESILPQLQETDEIIVSDDGSSDNTREIVRDLIRKDGRIKLIDGPCVGYASNFFNAIDHASNDVVFLSDQDDIWAEDKVEKILEVFDKDPECTTVLHKMYTFHQDISEKGEEIVVKYKKGFNTNVLFSSYWGCCMAFKKDFIKKFYPIKQPCLSHDQIIGLASERNGKTVFLEDKLIYHRIHKKNVTTAKRSIFDKIGFRFQMLSEYEAVEDQYYEAVPLKCPAFIDKLTTPKFELLAEILMLVFIADCCTFGGGRVVALGYFSFRIVVFALAFIFSLPFAIKDYRRITRNPWIYLTMMFGVAVIIWSIIGFYNGNLLGFIRADITRYLSFALMPGFLAVFKTREKFDKLINVVFYSSVALAIVATIFHFILPLSDETMSWLKSYILDSQLGGISVLPSGTYRVYFRSEIYTQIAILLGVWKVWRAKDRKERILVYICLGLLVFAWLVSYTRGFWFGLAISVVFVLLWQPRIFGECLKVAVISLLVAGLIVGVSAIKDGSPRVIKEVYTRVNITNMSIEDMLSTDEVMDKDIRAEELRVKTKRAHIEYIKESPIIGKGLGTQLVGVRDSAITEYSYMDAYMKFGFVGMIFFVIAYFVFVPRFLKNRVYSPKTNVTNSFYSLITLLVAGYVGVVATSYSNPFIVSPLGISYLLIIDDAVFNIRKFDRN